MAAKNDPLGTNLAHRHLKEAGSGVEAGGLKQYVGNIADAANAALPLAPCMRANKFLFGESCGELG